MKNTNPHRRIPVLVLFLSIVTVLLFTNCGGFTAANLGPRSDFAVIGPDGVSDDSPHPFSKLASSEQDKLYFNNSGDPNTAPRWQGKTINWYYNPAAQPAEFTDADALAIIQNGMAGLSELRR